MHPLVERLRRLPSVPAPVVATIALTSYAAIVVAVLAGLSIPVVITAAAVPWAPVLLRQLRWTYRHHGWIALLYLLLVAQAVQLLEHLAEVLEVIDGGTALGSVAIVESIDVVALAVGVFAIVALRAVDPGNRWLGLALAVLAVHLLEHTTVVLGLLLDAPWGGVGLLGDGGALGGGLPVPAVLVHLLLAALGTTLLLLAFAHTLVRARNAWLAQALSGTEGEVLDDMTARARILTLREGEVLLRQGEVSDAFYVVSRGQLEVLRTDGGSEQRLAMLGPGAMVGEIGLVDDQPRNATVRATSAAEVVRVDRSDFDAAMARSARAADVVRRVARRRGSDPSRTS